MEADELREILPHRYPFLLVDRILEVEEGRRAVGLKNVTANEPFFQGHFPGRLVMPGVLILEAMAQVGAVAVLTLPGFKGKIPLFAGADNVRFRKTVTPGDQLRIEVSLSKLRGNIGKGVAKALVGQEVVAEAELIFAAG